jgi:hypothetical protein
MDRVSETIEALADSLVASRPDRNTIVETLRGFRRVVLNDAESRRIEMNVQTNRMLDDLFRKFKHAQSPEQQ